MINFRGAAVVVVAVVAVVVVAVVVVVVVGFLFGLPARFRRE